MIGRVVEVASEGRHLARSRGFMTVSKEGAEEGRIPLDDVGVLLCSGRGLTYSNSLMTELANRGAGVVLCGSDHLPAAWLWPLVGHHVQALRMRRQLEASLPMCKRLWQSVVKAKIGQQARVLEMLGGSGADLGALARRVRSGDPENVEAQAARRYWSLLMGSYFRRDRFGGTANPFLNYGYTVLRAAVARSVVAAGLHPSIGIHHSNRSNAMCLVDDLMEPFRPLVDYRVAGLMSGGLEDLTTGARRALAEVLAMDMATDRGATPLQTCLERAAQSLAHRSRRGSRLSPSLNGRSLPPRRAEGPCRALRLPADVDDGDVRSAGTDEEGAPGGHAFSEVPA